MMRIDLGDLWCNAVNSSGDSQAIPDPVAPALNFVDAVSLLDRFPALSGVNLTVDEREIVLLKGPNGAGKSTLLRLCAGLAPLSQGQGAVLGFDVGDRIQRRQVRRHTGLLAHDTFLYDELTVEDNIRFWVKANRIDLDTIEPIMERLGLGTRLRTVKVGHLSAGQRRRTSLAVLVSRRPRLWLLDEPHAGLDPSGRDFVDKLVLHARGFGATILMASHDIDRAVDVATRVVTISGGLIRNDEQIVSQPPAGEADRDQPTAFPSWDSKPSDEDGR